MSTDALGDRMKMYEGLADRRLLPRVPVLARLDGRGFHNFTKGLQRPYDMGLSQLMRETTIHLVRESQAVCGYTQSDEITLAWSGTAEQPTFFDGWTAKMNSVLAGMAAVYFNHRLEEFLPPAYADKLPTFDCRVWAVPDQEEAANAFLWRERDATKNSVQMAARHYYEHADLHGKNGAELQDLLHAKGVNWNDYPTHFKRGVFVQARSYTRPFRADEIADLPPQHAARRNPELAVSRRAITVVEMPPFGRVINLADVIFQAAVPLTAVPPERV